VTIPTPRSVPTAIDSIQIGLRDMQDIVRKMLVTEGPPMLEDVELLVGILQNVREEADYAQGTFPTVAQSIRSQTNYVVE